MATDANNTTNEKINKPIKAVIFDLDGTLADTEPLHSLVRGQMFDRLGIPRSAETKMSVGGGPFWAELIAETGADADPDAVIAEYFDGVAAMVGRKKLAPSEGAKETLEKIVAAGIKTGVASASPKRYVTDVLGYIGLSGLIGATVGGDEVVNVKPAPDAYLLAAERLGVSPDECVAVEDSVNGSRSAIAAGMTCVGYYGNEVAARQKKQCPYSVSSMRQLAELLGL